MIPFIDLKHLQRGTHFARATRRGQWLARAAVVARDILLALGFGALCAMVGGLWFPVLGATILLAGFAGKRYLRG